MSSSTSYQLLSDVAEAFYLIARFGCQAIGTSVGGRAWERQIAAALAPTGACCWQGPGTLSLFGTQSASGLRHEIDAAGAADASTLMVEAKCVVTAGLSKDHLCCFDRKTFDLYVARRRAGEMGPHHRLIASASPVEACLHKYAYLYGIVIADPSILPLPLLLKIAGKHNADEFLRNGLLSELLRLGEAACGSMERKYAPDGPHHIRFNLLEFGKHDLDDLHWLHRTISEDILELVDSAFPNYYEAKAEELLDRISVGFNPR